MSVYRHEEFHDWETCDTPEDAIRIGLVRLKESGSHTVHITRPSLLFGICIMRNRPQDLATSHAEWVEILKKTEFR